MSLVDILSILGGGRHGGFERRADRAPILRGVQLLSDRRWIILLRLAILARTKINLRLAALLEDW